ncbi:MAG: outer membrane protein transport protein [Parachlamydiaceae bacterium]|nr:outer membrane protein transport protein [Parachlamydiaceae bacterium]
MTFHNWKLLISAVLFTATISTTNTASAFIAGTRAPGMGSTGIAYPQDAFAGAYNPAGILEVEDRFDLSASSIFNRGTAIIQFDRTPANEDKEKINGKFNPFNHLASFDFGLGINQTFCTNICGYSWEWAVGLVAYNWERQKTSYSKRVPLLTKEKKSKLGMEYIHDVVSPIISLRVTDCHTIGFSFDYHIQRLSIKGLEQFRHENHSYSPSHVTNNGDSYSRGFGATIGWAWEATDGLTIGAIYRSKTKMSRFHKYKGFFAQGGAIDSPAQWGVGAAYQFLPCATVTADIEWIEWDQIKALHNPLLQKDKKIGLAGTDHGPGFGFNNQVVYRLGIDYAINQFWTVRAGYQYANTVTKKSQTMLNLLFCKTSEHLASFGVSYMLTPCNEISFFYAHSFENEVNGKHAIPVECGPGKVDLTESKDFVGLSWAFIY